MSVVVETFVNRIRAIDEEVATLTELRAVIDDFLQAMLQNAVTKISALPHHPGSVAEPTEAGANCRQVARICGLRG